MSIGEEASQRRLIDVYFRECMFANIRASKENRDTNSMLSQVFVLRHVRLFVESESVVYCRKQMLVGRITL